MFSRIYSRKHEAPCGNRALLACYRRDASYDLVAWHVQECFRGAPRRQAFCVVGVKETWRTLSVSEGQRPESHTKTLMERASSRNQLSPLPKIGEGFGEWSEALLRIKEGWVVVTMQGSALQNLSGDRKKMNNWELMKRRVTMQGSALQKKES